MLVNEVLSLYGDDLQALTEAVEAELMLEDLGAFKQVRKELMPTFMFTTFDSRKSKYRSQLKPSAGRESPIEFKEIKSSAAAIRSLADDPKAIGLILSTGDSTKDQILAIGKKSWNLKTGGFATSSDLIASIDIDWAKEAIKDENVFEKLRSKFHALIDSRRFRETSSSLAPDTIRNTILTPCLKAAKDKGVELKMMMIYMDEKRIEKQNSRAKAKMGVLPIHMSDSQRTKFENDARRELRARLDKFKSSKADEVSTPKEFFKKITQEGYIEKIKIGKFVYKQSDDRINFKGLKGDTWYGESYIEYKVESEGDSEYYQLRKAWWEWQKEFLGKKKAEAEKIGKEINDDEVWNKFKDEYLNKRREMLPPDQIRIILKLDGSKIVPTKVQYRLEGDWEDLV